MTRRSVREYLEAMAVRYGKASKGEKGRILDEAVQVTGYHRKAVIRHLQHRRRAHPPRRSGRPRRYGPAAIAALKVAWEATDRLCSKRLQPFLPELIPVLCRFGERAFSSEVRAEVLAMSPATIDRLLAPFRQNGGRRGFPTTKPGSLLKAAIPIRTFADWDERKPGFLEVDLVAHCGESTEGFYLTTLSTVDVATGWSECQAVWGKGQDRVGAAIHHVAQRLPFPLLGLDSDNGGEFINAHLLAYCRRNKITFTRSRPYKKNDSAYVEQKNWTVVRRLVGYDRFSSKKALATLERLYLLVRLYMNFFQPVRMLQDKTRNGAKVRKVYDLAQTPYRRLLRSGILTAKQEQDLCAVYQGLDPRRLLTDINANLEHLWRLADRGPALPQRPLVRSR